MKHSREAGEEGSEVDLASLDPWVRRWSQGHTTISRELPPVKVALVPGSCPRGQTQGWCLREGEVAPLQPKGFAEPFQVNSAGLPCPPTSAWPKAQVREALFGLDRVFILPNLWKDFAGREENCIPEPVPEGRFP